MTKCNIGQINSIDTFSTLDGYGIRGVVFLKGCNLRCNCCHNPETWGSDKSITMTVEELVSKLSRYKMYYGTDGGVTFSGGEPLLQAEFVLQCVAKLREIGISCTIETAGNVEVNDTILQLVKSLDYVICDLKYPTEQEYYANTLGSLAKTAKFLDILRDCKVGVWLRTVVIPDINDSESKLKEYADIISQYPNVFRWELLPLSKLGFGKYIELGIENKLRNCRDLDMSKFDRLKKQFEFEIKSK